MAQTITKGQMEQFVKALAPQYDEKLRGRTLDYSQEVWLGKERMGRLGVRFTVKGAEAEGLYISVIPDEGERSFRLLLAPSEAEAMLRKGVAESRKTTRGNLVRHTYRLA
ncbi:MAG: hypothetical protein LUI09_01765 [Prevotellaceae bacterium]|nr:hypothetical protein [Prevotellaceae bacterium]